jgi:uncharacterized protein
MRNPVSSFLSESPVEHDARRWYRDRWPWLLTAGPFIVVVASLASAWMAVKSDDGLVAQDYYKQGLLINQRLKHTAPDPERRLGAIITVTAGGEVRARMEGLADAPPSLRLKLAHPALGSHTEIVTLERGADGDYVGALSEQTPGRWIVTLESDGWRLPTTTVAGHLSEIRLGTADIRKPTSTQ